MVIQSYTVRVHKVLVIQHCKPKLWRIQRRILAWPWNADSARVLQGHWK